MKVSVRHKWGPMFVEDECFVRRCRVCKLYVASVHRSEIEPGVWGDERLVCKYSRAPKVISRARVHG